VVEDLSPVDEQERDRLYQELSGLLRRDYVFEVRTAAKARLLKDFQDMYSLETEGLGKVEILHLLEQLDESSEADRNTALEYLDGEDLELRLAAARFLEKAGVLRKLLTQVEFADMETFQRNLELLKKAAEVKVVGFLDLLESKTLSPASLLIAAELLSEKGPVSLIEVLLSRGLTLDPKQSPEHRRLFETNVQAACTRGDDRAARRIAEFLAEHRYEQELISVILLRLTGRQGAIYVPTLLTLLEDPKFELRGQLEETISRFDPELYLQRLMDIVTSERPDFPHQVRISAFKVLGSLQLPYCMQAVLEHLPILPLQQARDFAVHLAGRDGELFTRRVLDILEGDDGKVRAAVIAAVPATERKDFVKPIRDALGDADVLVRSAAVWALLEYGDTRSVKDAREMLRDPVESVRREVARALGQHGNATTLNNFKDLCKDENEVDSVKFAAIEGLGYSKQPKAVEILVAYLKEEPSEELEERIIQALAGKRESKELSVLVEKLKDADHGLREKIVRVFETMGPEVESSMVELLREDIVSLRPYITSVLEETGFVDHTVRRLSHRDPQQRRDAAEVLSLIGTAAAFRGIVLAARDPDEQVRVMVTKALERLNTEEGREILEQLEQDPDRKIRKYTLWALERMKAQ